MDVIAVEAAARRAVHAVRESRKPYFLECRTYRLRAHSMFDAQLYRDKAEVEAWRHKEPIVRFQGWLEANHMIHPEDLARIEAEVGGRDRRGGRIRRGRNMGAGRATHPLHLCGKPKPVRCHAASRRRSPQRLKSPTATRCARRSAMHAPR